MPFGPGPAYHPHLDSVDFSVRVNNPLFPLTVGRALVYSLSISITVPYGSSGTLFALPSR